MSIFLNTILGILLGAIIYQDFKYRAIHLLLLIGVFICSCVLLWYHQKSLHSLLYIIAFLVTVIFFLWIYTALKNKDILAIKQGIGWGDILFFIAVAPLFSVRGYILFFISGMVMALIFFFLFKNVAKTKLIPLAGILAGHLIVLKFLSFSLNIEIFYNQLF